MNQTKPENFESFFKTHWKWCLWQTGFYTMKDYLQEIQAQARNSKFTIFKQNIKGDYYLEIETKIYKPYITKSFPYTIFNHNDLVEPEDNNHNIMWFPKKYDVYACYYSDLDCNNLVEKKFLEQESDGKEPTSEELIMKNPCFLESEIFNYI